MSRGKFITIAVVLLWIAGGMQGTVAVTMGGSAFTPNILLAALAVLGMWTNRQGGLLLGFATGLIEGALGGTRIWSYVLARMIAGVLAATAGKAIPERGPIVSSVVAAGTALVSNLVLIFVLAPLGVAQRLAASVGGAITTGLVGALLALIIGFLDRNRRSNDFGM